MKLRKRRYETPAVSAVTMEGRESLLVGSVINEDMVIVSSGQEIGAIYDFSAKSTIDEGSIFNQDWEAGTGSFPDSF